MLPRGTPRRVLDPCPPGAPTTTLYEVIGEVELTPAIGAGPSQRAITPKPQESGRVLDLEQTPVSEQTHFSQVSRKRTKRSASSGQGPSPGQAWASERSKMPERARTLERTRTPERTKTSERAKTSDRGRALVAYASPAPASDCIIVERWEPPPSQGTSTKKRWAASASCGQNKEQMAESDHSPCQGSNKKKKVVPAVERFGSRDRTWEEESAATDFEEEPTPSPTLRRASSSCRIDDC